MVSAGRVPLSFLYIRLQLIAIFKIFFYSSNEYYLDARKAEEIFGQVWPQWKITFLLGSQTGFVCYIDAHPALRYV